MSQVSPKKLGLVIGGVIGLWHLTWALLVALGWAQPLIDWIFRLHMIEPVYKISVFNLGAAAMLVIVTSLFGYAFGWVAGALWNRFTRS